MSIIKKLAIVLIVLTTGVVCAGFFDDPFFNDPFFNNIFGGKRPKTDEDYTYYIVIEEPGQRKVITNMNQQQQAQQQKKQAPKAAPKHIHFKPSSQPSSPFGGLFPFLGTQEQQHAHGQQGPYKQYKANKSNNTVTFKDVLGQEEAIKDVAEVVDFLKNPAKYHRLGAELPKGILLEGPPGTGKTLLARAVANEAGCTFIHTSGSQFINKYVGTGANNVRKLFEQARKQAPAIIFIDEIDAVGSRKHDENQEYKHTINELLTQLDGFQQEENIIVMAATNLAKSLDKALMRPGRFDRIVRVGLPNRKGRQDILQYYMHKKKLDASINPTALAKNFSSRTTMFSGAQLKKLVNEAALLACRENAAFLTEKHFEDAYDKVTLGPKNNLDRTQEQLDRTIYHEVGHLVVKLLTNQPIAKVSILSKGDALGATFEKEKYETISEYQKEELKHKISALYGGFAAEKIFLNSTRPGAVSDLEQINKISRFMIRECGMGEGELEGIVCNKYMSIDLQNKFEEEELKLNHGCRRHAEQLLQNNESMVHTFVNALREKEELNEKEIYQIAKAFIPTQG